MSRKLSERLNVAKILNEFQKSEGALPHRKGTFRIDKPFEEALNTIVKTKLPSKKSSK
jgi:hypothetical protein